MYMHIYMYVKIQIQIQIHILNDIRPISLNDTYNENPTEKNRLIVLSPNKWFLEGKSALQAINKKMGLGFDEWDLEFYTKMFTEQLKRDPTDVECFDLGVFSRECMCVCEGECVCLYLACMCVCGYDCISMWKRR